MKEKVVVIVVFICISIILFFSFKSNYHVIDSTFAPPYCYGTVKHQDILSFKKDLVTFGDYTNMNINFDKLNVRRVLPKFFYSGINGWDYLAYEVDKLKIVEEINKWKSIPYEIIKIKNTNLTKFNNPPRWWSKAEELEPIIKVRKTHKFIQFQTVFLDRKNNRVCIYNDWGD